MVKSFNKTLHKGLGKICGVKLNVWDDKVPIVLWDYTTTYKRSFDHTLLKLVYGQEVFIPLHFRSNVSKVLTIFRYDRDNTEQKDNTSISDIYLDEIKFMHYTDRRPKKNAKKLV